MRTGAPAAAEREMPFLALVQHFRRTLIAAQGERAERPDLVGSPNGEAECAWAAFERDVMFREVNRLRTEEGFEPVSIEEVMRVESWACGHLDYTAKFALYCAEMAAGFEVSHR